MRWLSFSKRLENWSLEVVSKTLSTKQRFAVQVPSMLSFPESTATEAGSLMNALRRHWIGCLWNVSPRVATMYQRFTGLRRYEPRFPCHDIRRSVVCSLEWLWWLERTMSFWRIRKGTLILDDVPKGSGASASTPTLQSTKMILTFVFIAGKAHCLCVF